MRTLAFQFNQGGKMSCFLTDHTDVVDVRNALDHAGADGESCLRIYQIPDTPIGDVIEALARTERKVGNSSRRSSRAS